MKRRRVLRTFLASLTIAMLFGVPAGSVRGEEAGGVPLTTVSSATDANTTATEPDAAGDGAAAPPTAPSDQAKLTAVLEQLLPGNALTGPLSAVVTIGVVSIAPAALLMTTCYVRFSVVLSLVRQGLGTQGMPSNQIVASLALFLSAMVMWPIWTQAWRAGGEPYQAGEISLSAAVDQGSLPVRRWMASQIEAAGNRETVLMFLERHPSAASGVATYDDVPAEALLPAFLVSELETAFALGVRLLIPFLLIDLVVATLVVSSGLVMLPPTVVSLPLKLLVFVMADGWTLVVTSLLNGVSTTGMP